MADESHPDDAAGSEAGNLQPPRLLGGRRKPKAAKPIKPAKPVKAPKSLKVSRAKQDLAPTDPEDVAATPTEIPAVVEEPEPVDDTAVWEPVEPAATEAVPADDSEDTTAGVATKTRSRRTLPRPSLRKPGGLRRPSDVDGRVAAVVAGIVAGFVLVGGVVLGLQGCQAVQGTESCGTGPGLGLLVVIFVVAVLVGRFLLGLFAQPDPGTTSFLSVGVTSVVALLALTSVIDSWTMIIVIPALTALTMLGAWLVTTRLVGSADA